MAAVQLIWGVVLLGTGWVNNFAGLIALRILLGMLEAPIVPGNYLIVGMWYSRRWYPVSYNFVPLLTKIESSQFVQD